MKVLRNPEIHNNVLLLLPETHGNPPLTDSRHLRLFRTRRPRDPRVVVEQALDEWRQKIRQEEQGGEVAETDFLPSKRKEKGALDSLLHCPTSSFLRPLLVLPNAWQTFSLVEKKKKKDRLRGWWPRSLHHNKEVGGRRSFRL